MPQTPTLIDTRVVQRAEELRERSGRPRIIVAGTYRDALGLPADGFVEGLRRGADVAVVPAPSPLRSALSIYRQCARLVDRDGFELLHLQDPRLAPVGALLRGRKGLPVTLTLSGRAGVLENWPVFARFLTRASSRLDEGSCDDESTLRLQQERTPDLPLNLVPPAARELPMPSPRDAAIVSQAMRDVRPGRAILGLAWSGNRVDLRWFRDAVLPALEGKPLCLLFGAPSRREARLLLSAVGVADQFRILPGTITGSRLAAIARWTDAIAVPAASRPQGAQAVAMTLALAVSGAPIISDGATERDILDHEHNALIVERGDERAFAGQINSLLALPAIQRHYLGEEFARHTLAKWTWDASVERHLERFAALVGRPQIPAELRAA